MTDHVISLPFGDWTWYIRLLIRQMEYITKKQMLDWRCIVGWEAFSAGPLLDRKAFSPSKCLKDGTRPYHMMVLDSSTPAARHVLHTALLLSQWGIAHLMVQLSVIWGHLTQLSWHTWAVKLIGLCETGWTFVFYYVMTNDILCVLCIAVEWVCIQDKEFERAILRQTNQWRLTLISPISHDPL